MINIIKKLTFEKIFDFIIMKIFFIIIFPFFIFVKGFSLCFNFFSILKNIRLYNRTHWILIEKIIYYYCFKKHSSRFYLGGVSCDDYHKSFPLFKNRIKMEIVFYNSQEFYKKHPYSSPKDMNKIYIGNSKNSTNEMLYGEVKWDYLRNLNTLYPVIEFIITLKSIFMFETYKADLSDESFRPFSINLIVYKESTLIELLNEHSKTEYLLKSL